MGIYQKDCNDKENYKVKPGLRDQSPSLKTDLSPTERLKEHLDEYKKRKGLK